jgi:cell division protein FtsQ
MSRSRASTEAGRRRASSRAGGPAPRPRSSGSGAARRASTEAPAPKRARPRPARRSRPRPATSARRPRAKAPRRSVSLRRPRPLRALRVRAASRSRGGRAKWRYRLGVVAILALTVGAAYMFWLRDSSLVAVDNVDVVGVTSGDRDRIVTVLTKAAEEQTTLHADPGAIEAAARPFPTVAAVSVDPNFPHGMRIEVDERPPALMVSAGGHETPAAADGTLLEGVDVGDDPHLPVLEVAKAPAGGRLDGGPLEQALVLGAAPEPLRPLIEKADSNDDYGIVVTLRGGIPVRFGSDSEAAEKWAAAAAVLADPKLDGLTYVDVRVPERAAAGGASPAPDATDLSSTG